MGCGVSRRNVAPERSGSGTERSGSTKENGFSAALKSSSSPAHKSASSVASSPGALVRCDVEQQQQARLQRRKMVQDRQLRTVSAAQELSGRHLEDRDRLSINGTSHFSSRTSSPHGSRTNSKRVHFEKGSIPESPVPSTSGATSSSLRLEPKSVAVR